MNGNGEASDGGLIFQKLRKFINVIVSNSGATPLYIFANAYSQFRMNYVMSDSIKLFRCRVFACLVASQRVNHLCSSPSLVSISCPEVM